MCQSKIRTIANKRGNSKKTTSEQKKNNYKNYIFYGGFDNAERKALIIYPEKYNMEMLEKNYNKILSIVRIELPEEMNGKYAHRNYLGGIVKLGLKREKVGDILVFNNGADIITFVDFANTSHALVLSLFMLVCWFAQFVSVQYRVSMLWIKSLRSMF